MEKGLFFNAFPDEDYETGYDRNYSADDISNWLKVLITNGVVKTDNEEGTGNPLGLKVVADSGMTIKVNVGLAVIQGKPYINNSSLSLTLDTAPTSGTRYDLVILRMDNTQIQSARKTYCLIQSQTTKPTVDDLTRTDSIYDLLLGYVVVNENVSSISQTNIIDTRGYDDSIDDEGEYVYGDLENVCPWCTAVKGYDDYYDAIVQRFEYDETLETAGTLVTTDLAVNLYNSKYSLVSVYCNGLREDEEDYSVIVTGSYIQIQFIATKSAGSEITVVLENFIDGEGMSTVLDQYNELVQEVEDLAQINEFNYFCNGSTDNVLLSQFVSAKIASGGEVKVNVIGTFGATAPCSGSGTNVNPYSWFHITSSYGGKYTLDFSNCSKIVILPTTGTVNYIFENAVPNEETDYPHGHIIGLKLSATNMTTNTYIKGFKKGLWLVERSEFAFRGYNMTYIAENGTFNDCRGEVYNASGYSYCFYPVSASLMVISRGEYYAYNVDTTKKSAIVGLTLSGRVVINGINAPTKAVSGYYQSNLIYQTSGALTAFGMISALPNDVPSATSSVIYGTLEVSLPDAVY